MKPLTPEQVMCVVERAKETNKGIKIYTLVRKSNCAYSEILFRKITKQSSFDGHKLVYFTKQEKSSVTTSPSSGVLFFTNYWHAYGYKQRAESKQNEPK